MKFFDFFAGIGGFRLGMEMAGHECVGHCEIDQAADRSYRAMHNVSDSEVFFDDIRTIEPADMPEADVYCFGFPCQAFSIAGRRGGSQILEELYFLKSCGWLKSESLKYYSPKMSRDYLTTMRDGPLEPSSEQWMNWGTMWSGSYLTARILEYPKTGNGCSLSDILESQVDEKYFLSDQATKRILAYKDTKVLQE